MIELIDKTKSISGKYEVVDGEGTVLFRSANEDNARLARAAEQRKQDAQESEMQVEDLRPSTQVLEKLNAAIKAAHEGAKPKQRKLKAPKPATNSVLTDEETKSGKGKVKPIYV